MTVLNDDQTALIRTMIEVNGVEQESLIIDLHDHICSHVETAMDDGQSFELALTNAIAEFGDKGLQKVQAETYSILTSNPLNMKTITFVTGAAAALMLLFGMTFKVMHWPFANLLIVLGSTTLVAIFLPLLLIHNIIGAKTWIDRILHISGYVGVALFGSGVIFKSMHWPFATNLIFYGAGVLLLFYLPIYFYRRYRQSQNKSVTAATFLVSFSALMLLFVLLPKGENSSITMQRLEAIDHGLVSVGKKLTAEVEQSSEAKAVVTAANEMLSALFMGSAVEMGDDAWVSTSDLKSPQNRATVRYVVYETIEHLEALTKAMNQLRAAQAQQFHAFLPFEIYLAAGQSQIEVGHLQSHFHELTLAEAVQMINRIKVEALQHSSLLARAETANE